MTDEMRAGPSLGPVVEHGPVNPIQTVAEQLRANAKRHRANKTVDVKIPDYDGLFVVFRALDDYREVRDPISRAVTRHSDLAERDIDISVQTLLLSSRAAGRSYAVINGERVELGLPLGLALYDVLWPADSEGETRPQTDEEAVTLLFGDNTVQITTLAAQLNTWFKDTTRGIEDDLLGEFKAAS